MKFPQCDETPLGLYPIVDRTEKLKPLYECGITTAQLRVKDLNGSELEDEVVYAIELSRQYNVRFFLNDYWQLAIKHGAYGVHLGQEDIREADIEAIYSAGLRLGISSHTPKEIEIALGFAPSYLAIGPIYEPISKKMAYENVGLDNLKAWAAYVDYPIVAIGGITQENIKEVARTKAASGIAMISAVLDEDGEVSKERTKALLNALQER
jgi:thiamine-phosphate pyrophosphorylase/hydroxymethylpyrimidine kinase/phosphomethylpyrimidine kinase/thiamine-phosphate diphosphorylase